MTTASKYLTARQGIERLMQDGRWWTSMRLKSALREQFGVRVSESTITAKVRDLRKAEHGGYEIECSRTQSKAGGPKDLYIYRMVLGGE